MIWFVVSAAVQLLCILHAYRTRREQYWYFILLFFPVMGVLAYGALEILPEYMGPAGARARVKAAGDPVKRLNAAEQDLARADTAATHLARADALFDLKSYCEAILAYRTALERMNGRDTKIEAKLAAALFEADDHEAALVALDALEPVPGSGEADRIAFLRARVLTELGREDEALSLYAEIANRLPGPAARARYAALLLVRGDAETAERVLAELVATSAEAKGLTSEELEMRAWAKVALAKLRRG